MESGGGEVPVDYFIEWLTEWGRDVRRRQRGLLLLTAHRTRGLELDYLAVLDGDWNCTGRHEDVDATRRLYYAAMTRARQTLTLARLDGSLDFQAGLAGHAATIRRAAAELPPCSEAVQYRHVWSSLEHVDLGFVRRRRAGEPIHGALAALPIGDPLDVRAERDEHVGRRWIGPVGPSDASQGGSSRRPGRISGPQRCSPWRARVGRRRNRSTVTPRNATPGKQLFPSWYSSRTVWSTHKVLPRNKTDVLRWRMASGKS